MLEKQKKSKEPFGPPKGLPPGSLCFGGPVDKVSLTLRISGESLDVEEVSKLLKRKPTDFFSKETHDPDGKYPKRKPSWRFSIESKQPKTTDMDELVKRLLSKFPDRPQLWKGLNKKFKMDLFCGIFLETGNRGCSLSAQTCKMLADRSLTIGFDIYGPGDVSTVSS